MKKIALLCLLLATIILAIPHAHAVPPTVETYIYRNSVYLERNLFSQTENVYVRGTGYPPLVYVNVSVVDDKASWNDQDSITGIKHTLMIQTDAGGNLPYTNMGTYSAGSGAKYYDVVVDTDDDGKYDQATDALDNNDVVTGGFVVVTDVGGVIVPLDKLGVLAPYIGLASIIAVGAVVATVAYKRRKK